MIAKPMSMPLHDRGVFGVLGCVLYGWWLALGPGQDGPVGHLPGELAARRRD